MSKNRSFPTLPLLFLVSLSFASSVLALDYSGSQKNQATFETLEETRASSPVAVASLETNSGKTFKSHPVLDGYPEGTTYVYRSANLFGGRAAARLNTDLVVFAEESFPDKAAARRYLEGLGVIKIIDEAVGSVVLVTPADPKAGFGAGDQKHFAALLTAMLSQKASERSGDTVTFYSDAEYFGGWGYTYLVGIDGGATFLNNYVAAAYDYVNRIAGLLLINGTMADIRSVAAPVPAYLVNAPASTVDKYREANDADAFMIAGGVETYFNQELPVKQVVVAKDQSPDPATYIKSAYDNLFLTAMRVPVSRPGMETASKPYQGYSLTKRNAVINGVTRNGIHLIRRTEDRFSDLKTGDGEYLQTWFEYLPDEVLNGTAPAGTVPLILAMHGGGDDPRVFVDEIGLLELAGSERFAMVAPEHQYLGYSRRGNRRAEGILPEILPRFVKYVLESYPTLDPSRVYVTGYSMGGAATLRAINGDPSVFAAAVPMAAAPYTGTPEQAAQLRKAHMPIMLTTSTFDLPGAFDQANGTIAAGYQTQLNLFLGYNGMKTIGSFDFKTYPINGFQADRTVHVTLNNEYGNTSWYLNNAGGAPMVAVNYTQDLIHALYPGYARIAWDFAKHYSRDQKTGVIKYDPNIE